MSRCKAKAAGNSRRQAGASDGKAICLVLVGEIAGTGQAGIKGLLPAGTRVAHMNGTSGTDCKLTRAIHDVGIVTLPDGRHLAIAVFVSDSTAAQEVRGRVIAKVARAASDQWAARR